MGLDRSMLKMVYAAVISAMASKGAYKGNNYTANEYQTKHWLGTGKKRTSRTKRQFHRQKG